MYQAEVTLEQIDSIPKDSSWDLPHNERYVRLGCVACPNALCFKVKGLRGLSAQFSGNPEAAEALSGILGEVEKKREIQQGMIATWEEKCEAPCPQEEDMSAAIELLNETFGSNIGGDE